MADSGVTIPPRVSSDLLAEIEKTGRIRVGVSLIVPWAMHDKDGQLVGFEIDVARKLARDLRAEVDFYPTELRYLIPDLLAQRFDIIVSGLSITAQRALQVNFSAAYNSTNIVLAASTKLSGELKTVQAFNERNISVGVLEGSTAEEIASTMLPNAEIRADSEDDLLFADLIGGKIHAAVADSPRPEIVAKLYPTKVTVPLLKPLTTFPAAFAVRRGDLDFINFLNSWIEARTVDKWLENRRTYWFKTTDWAKSL